MSLLAPNPGDATVIEYHIDVTKTSSHTTTTKTVSIVNIIQKEYSAQAQQTSSLG